MKAQYKVRLRLYVRIIIPGTASAGGPYDAVIQAVSANDPAESNLTTDRIALVAAASVNIGNYDGLPGTNDASVNQNANPGVNVDCALDVINTGGSSDNFNLSAAVPAGWVATYYLGTNANGVLDLPELTPITGVGPIGGNEVNVIARVAVPVGAVPGVNPVTFRATSANNGAIFDEIADTPIHGRQAADPAEELP